MNFKHYPCTAEKKEYQDLCDSINYLGLKIQFMNNYQTKFIANISHDFRSPLTSIKGYTEAILDGTIPVWIQEKYLKIILSETKRLTKLTSNLLQLNQIETNGILLDLRNFDINNAIKNTAHGFEQRCEYKNISLLFNFQIHPLIVRADRDKISQVVQNLIDNAIKFSSPNSKIEIQTDLQNNKAIISIKDHGIGISLEEQKKIWNRFYKSDSSRGKDKTGTGLGLTITKEIIEAHREEIHVYSSPNSGTEFVFTLSPPNIE